MKAILKTLRHGALDLAERFAAVGQTCFAGLRDVASGVIEHLETIPRSLAASTTTVLLAFSLGALLLLSASCAHTLQGVEREQALYQTGTNLVGHLNQVAPYLPAPVGNTMQIVLAIASSLRDNVDYARHIKPGKRRVTFVGDSFTAGHGIKNVEDRFANRLRRSHPEWEIHVLARNGLDTGEELKYMTDLLAQGYQLDQVVLVYCLNDVSDLIPELVKATERINAEAQNSGWLCHKSYLVNTLCSRWQISCYPEIKDYYRGVREAYRGLLWQEQKQWLKAFRDLVQSRKSSVGSDLSVPPRTWPELRIRVCPSGAGSTLA